VSSLTIGRADAIDYIANIDRSGEELTITGALPSSDVPTCKIWRQQLLGYLDNLDEPVIPVTWAGDSTVDGFYIPTGINIGLEPGQLKAGFWPYEIKLHRIEQYSRPLIESVLLGALRANSAGVTTTEVPWLAVPYNAKNLGLLGTVISAAWPLGVNKVPYATDTGSIVIVTSAEAVDHDCKAQFQCAPTDFYAGAATFEVGATPKTVIGRQYAQDPTNWRLSNGILRVTPTVSGTSLRLSIAAFDGTVWDPAISFSLNNHGVGEMTGTTPAAVAVLRNSVEEVIIRITFTGDALYQGTLDLVLRRGARMVYGYLALINQRTAPGIIPTTTVAATSLTGGLRKTTNDGGGNRLVIGSPDTITKDLTTGEIYRPGTQYVLNFAIGFEIPGGTAGVANQAQGLILQYLAADTERLTVVNR
jgi:hypothetical protein